MEVDFIEPDSGLRASYITLEFLPHRLDAMNKTSDFQPYYVTDGARLPAPDDKAVRRFAIEFIRKKWGSLSDLPEILIPVIWVGVYQCLKVSMTAEANGGEKAMTKNMLIGDRRLTWDVKNAITQIDFLQKMISYIRSEHTQMKKLGAAQLVVDILKWKMIDAGNMSGLRRAITRQFAKANPQYEKPVPPEIRF
jgi:hypothetical protein